MQASSISWSRLWNSAGFSKAMPRFPERTLHQMLTSILALYAAGLALPEVDPELDPREEPFFDQHARQMLREQLAERLCGGPDPERQDTTSLADDLAALYVSVKEGLFSVPEHSGRIPAFVIWAWSFAIENDAGRQSVNAIGELHSLVF